MQGGQLWGSCWTWWPRSAPVPLPSLFKVQSYPLSPGSRAGPGQGFRQGWLMSSEVRAALKMLGTP